MDRSCPRGNKGYYYCVRVGGRLAGFEAGSGSRAEPAPEAHRGRSHGSRKMQTQTASTIHCRLSVLQADSVWVSYILLHLRTWPAACGLARARLGCLPTASLLERRQTAATTDPMHFKHQAIIFIFNLIIGCCWFDTFSGSIWPSRVKSRWKPSERPPRTSFPSHGISILTLLLHSRRHLHASFIKSLLSRLRRRRCCSRVRTNTFSQLPSSAAVYPRALPRPRPDRQTLPTAKLHEAIVFPRRRGTLSGPVTGPQ